MLKRRRRIVLVFLFFALELHHVAQSQSIKDVDPTNRKSKLREAARDLESEARELGRRIDERRLDAISEPERKLGEAAYFSYKAFVENKQVKTRVVRLQKGDFHFEQIAPILPKVEIEKVTFYFDAFVPADMAAVTFGKKVYIDDPYDPEDADLTRLIAHELVHVSQYDYLGGEKKFAHRYFGQIAKSTREAILKGNLNVEFIHDDLDLEKEAESYEILVPNYNYKKYDVDARKLEGYSKRELKDALQKMNSDELGASSMQIDGPTLKVGLASIDGATLQVAVDKMDMATLREGMIRVDGATLTEILKRLHPTKRAFVIARLDDATRREVEKRRKHWRK